jgi:cytochrome o ubiquinol oxidase subunit 1
LRDLSGDPWDGRSLEWYTLSPPPHFNFAVLPDVHGEEAYWTTKREAIEREQLAPEPDYHPIHMPVNSATGFITAFFSTLIGFALIWHIWWLAIAGFVGAYATFVVFAWRDQGEYEVGVDELRETEHKRRRAREEWLGLEPSI